MGPRASGSVKKSPGPILAKSEALLPSPEAPGRVLSGRLRVRLPPEPPCPVGDFFTNPSARGNALVRRVARLAAARSGGPGAALFAGQDPLPRFASMRMSSRCTPHRHQAPWQRPQAGRVRGRDGGEGGIRTLGRGLGPYDGLANRCFRPLSHLSAEGVVHLQFTIRVAGGQAFREAADRRFRC